MLPHRRTGPMRGEDNTSHAGNPAARGQAEVHHPLLTAVELEKTRASPFREDNTSHAGNPAARGQAEVHHPLLTAVELEKTRASPFRAVVAG